MAQAFSCKFPVNLLPIFRTAFFKNTSGRLLPNFVSWSNYILCRLYSWSQEHHSCVVKTDEETIIHPLGKTTIPLYQILTDTQNKQRHSKEQIDWNDNHQAILDKLLHTLWHFEVLHSQTMINFSYYAQMPLVLS